MKTKVELPEEEILEKYKNVWWTPTKLAKKYGTTPYMIRKLLSQRGVLRKSTGLEKLLIGNLLKYERQFDIKTKANELRIALGLIHEYPEEDFWKSFTLGFKLNSLAYLQSVDGKALLKKKYAEFKFEIPEKETHNMGEKVGDDVEVVSRPLSIHEFLKR